MDEKSKVIACEPDQIGERVAEFLKEGDLEGIVSMFHPECSIYFPPELPPKRGHAGVRQVFAEFVAIKPVLSSKVTNKVINGDTALIQAQWKFEDADGSVIAEGKSTEVAKRLNNGGWGYFIDCPIGIPVC